METHYEYLAELGLGAMRLAGRLDAGSATDVTTLMGDGNITGSLMVDCAGLEFVDSVGLGALMLLMRRVQAAGGDMALYGLKDTVRRTFEIARMHQVLAILDDEAAARRWLA